jgi:hypothetical protein
VVRHHRRVRWPQTTLGGTARPSFWRWTAGKVPNVSTGAGRPQVGIQTEALPRSAKRFINSSQQANLAGSRLNNRRQRALATYTVVALAHSYAESSSRPDKAPFQRVRGIVPRSVLRTDADLNEGHNNTTWLAMVIGAKPCRSGCFGGRVRRSDGSTRDAGSYCGS